jgi:hypothetical protein
VRGEAGEMRGFYTPFLHKSSMVYNGDDHRLYPSSTGLKVASAGEYMTFVLLYGEAESVREKICDPRGLGSTVP